MAQTSFEGIIKSVGELEHPTAKLTKVEIIVEEVRQDGRESLLKLQAINNMATAAEYLKQGQRATFDCDINGKEWQGKDKVIHFQNMNITNFHVIEEKDPQMPAARAQDTGYNLKAKEIDDNKFFEDKLNHADDSALPYDDDLPF